MQTAAARAPKRRETKRDLTRLAGREAPEKPPVHPELAAENELEKLPPAIQHGRFAVNYLRPHFEHDEKTDSRTVGLELSLELREEHEKVIPKEIKAWWEQVKNGGVKSIALLGVPMQYVELGIAPEGDDRDLEIKAAPINKVSLAVVEEKGSGEATEVIRLSFRVLCDLDAKIEKFCCRHYGKVLWCRMQAVQGSLL